MDELFKYIIPVILVLGPVAVFSFSRMPFRFRALKAVGYVWVLGLLFYGEAWFSLPMGPMWLLAISPGFAIVIWMKCRERRGGGSRSDKNDGGAK